MNGQYIHMLKMPDNHCFAAFNKSYHAYACST